MRQFRQAGRYTDISSTSHNDNGTGNSTDCDTFRRTGSGSTAFSPDG